MVRELADFDPRRMREVARWGLRDALIAFVHRIREQARVQYRHDLLVWASTAPHSAKKIEPPKPPRLLKD
jgi:hypothetical protein